ncbi:MarR family winged helix-turn-helix transcriptional regulator, partial [Desulfococcus sp.]
QFFLIVAIMEDEGLLPSELAEKTAQDRPTITGLLDRMEKVGWVERKADPKDRRSLRIYLGPRGNELRQPLLKLFEETNQKFIDRFSEKEWRLMQSFLVRLEQ